VAKNEFSDLFCEPRFLLTVALYLIIALAGMPQGFERYDYALSSYNEALQATDEYRNLQGVGAWWLDAPGKPSIFLISQKKYQCRLFLYTIMRTRAKTNAPPPANIPIIGIPFGPGS